MPIHDAVRQRLHPLSVAVTSNRIALYTLFSTCAVVGTIANACRSYSNFYSVAIYLSRSSRSVLVLANFGLLVALHVSRVLQRLFFGSLQPREVERLYDQTWIFVTESLLAFTIFRDDFDIPFVLMFGFLLFVKCFHWLMADRVETMDQTTYPGPPLIFHVRMNLLFLLLWTIDIAMFALAVESTLTHGVGGMVLFASEYAILMAGALNSVARYILSILDYRRARTRGGENAPPMENKSMYVFYIELVTDFLKLATYLTFFMLILTFYGLPLNIVRDVYLTARSFITRLRALVRYHNATRDMDRRYPNATEAELSEMSDRTCIICREEMVSRNPQAPAGEAPAEAPVPQPQDGPNMTPKKLPCGHIFHFQCLRSWLERQQSCPTCRRTVLETNPPNEPQTQGRAGGVVPPPQPGGRPMPGGQQPVGRVGGWVGRLLGIPGQPPPIQGQFIDGQFIAGGPPQQQQQQPMPMGWAAGPHAPPPFYYPLHYPQHMQQPQQLAQLPPFRGFYGPGGVWQPWGMDPQLFGNQPQEAGPAPAQQQLPQQPAATGTPTIPTESERLHDPRLAPAPTPTSTPSSSTAEQPPTPRAAAAQAALRRLGFSEPTPDSLRSGANGPMSTAGESVPTSTTPGPSTSSTSTPTPDVAGSSTPQSNPNTARPQIPSLIPLHDLALSGQNMRPAMFVPPLNPYQPHHTGFTRNPMQTGRPQQGQSPPQSQQYGATRNSRPMGPRMPLAQLPATLTDEQLARLDRLTRDAIDERLRVLEGVSGAVHRCIEELTRIRSVLPVTTPTASPPSQTQGQGQERTRADTSAASPSAPVAGSSTTLGDGQTMIGDSSAAASHLSGESSPSVPSTGSNQSVATWSAVTGSEGQRARSPDATNAGG